MLLHRLARVSQEVAATSARSRKTALLAELFRDAEADDVPIVIPYLAGRLPQGRIGVGWKVLSRPVDPAAEPGLTVRRGGRPADRSWARCPAPAPRRNGPGWSGS